MSRWIRNCFLPRMSAVDWGAAGLAFFMREAMLVGGWAEFANNGDAAWTHAANVIVDEPGGPNGFAVLASQGRQIYDPSGRFTQAMVDDGYIIALRGTTNDQNYSMWRIAEYIDANNIRVDSHGFSPYGWVDESGMAGRILDYGSRHLTGAWVEMDPPGGNNRAKIGAIELTVGLRCSVEPRAGLGDFTTTPAVGLYLYDDDDYAITLNAYFDGNNALFWKHADADGRTDVCMFGELEGVSSKDTWPGFVWSTHNISWPGQPTNFTSYMLGASTLIINAYTSWITRTTWAANVSYNVDAQEYYRLINGRPGFCRLRKPQVILGNTAGDGAFVRGYLPVVRFGPDSLSTFRPLDARGEWWHLRSGLYVPRNGPGDQQLVTSYS